jgi:hypothetical protein
MKDTRVSISKTPPFAISFLISEETLSHKIEVDSEVLVKKEESPTYGV